MEKILIPALLAIFAAGCLSSAPPEPKSWTVNPRSDLKPTTRENAYRATRLGGVTVEAPFNGSKFAVRRADGSVAFDPCNGFAARPDALLRGPLRSRLEADGRFGHVVNSSSAATVDAAVEVHVSDLSLDCRKEGTRTARAAVSVDVLRGRTREVTGFADGAGEADAADGDYSRAFSSAVDSAIRAALENLK